MKKRYQTEQQILDEIDKAHASAKRMIDEALAAEEYSRQVKFGGDPGLAFMIDEKERVARKLRKSASSILDCRCVRLKEKLAEFRTPQLPVIDNGDITIPRRTR